LGVRAWVHILTAGLACHTKIDSYQEACIGYIILRVVNEYHCISNQNIVFSINNFKRVLDLLVGVFPNRCGLCLYYNIIQSVY